ncbi:MAG: hypothetical protein H5T73_03760 [Actinobacteria bacterium]|nr:hypothetical protein [Actinomycetota bacterium]
MFNLTTVVPRLVSEAKGIEEIEEKIARLVFEPGRRMLEAVFAYLDWRLAKRRGKGLRMVGARERDVLTRLGVVRVGRRYTGTRREDAASSWTRPWAGIRGVWP